MPKLHQVLALSKTRLSEAKKRGDEIYHLLQKNVLTDGGYGTYKPETDEDAPLAPERHPVQVNVEKYLKIYARTQIPAWDITFTKDHANQVARGTVVIDGETVWSNVPVSSLIFLEKQLTDLHTVISKVPVLDAGEEWQDELDSDGNHQTVVSKTVKTKKITTHDVVVPPTEHHPAQVVEHHKDTTAGVWTRHKVSGAIYGTRKEELLDRVSKWREAVKLAREEANTTDIVFEEHAEDFFRQLLA